MHADERPGIRGLAHKVTPIKRVCDRYTKELSPAALRDYEPRVVHYTTQLMQAIEKGLNEPMNMTKWFNLYSIDVMGDLSFGKSFDMLADNEDKYFLNQLHADMKMIGLFSHLMWLFPFFKRIPGINADYLKFWGWLDDKVQNRVKVSP